MFEHYIVGMAPQEPDDSSPLSSISPRNKSSAPSSSSYFSPKTSRRSAESTPPSGYASLVAALESDAVEDYISTSNLPAHDEHAEHMYLSPYDADTEVTRSRSGPSRSRSTHSRRQQRQVNTKLLAEPSHQRSISDLISDMVDTDTQCTVTPAPLVSASDLAPIETPQPITAIIEPDDDIPIDSYNLTFAFDLPPSTPLLPPVTSTMVPEGPILVDSSGSEDAPLPQPSASEDEGFSELPFEGVLPQPTSFLGHFANANATWGIRRYSHMRIQSLVTGKEAEGEEGTMAREMGTTGVAVQPRVRKRIGRRRGVRRRPE